MVAVAAAIVIPSVPSSSGSPLNIKRHIRILQVIVAFCPLIIGESAQQRPLKRERRRGFSGVV
jgi:hypothetical protein